MKKRTLNCNGRLVRLDKPIVMGIVNVTPDSFYDGGHYLTETDLLKRCEAILDEGADIIDVGAVSTRPGARQVGSEEENKRLTGAMTSIRKHFPDALISIDTYRADVARDMVENYHADIINDISAGVFDENMFATVAGLNVPYILMHMQGTPETMQMAPVYDNLMDDIVRFFSERVHHLRNLGVKDIIIDPGFGFGKNLEHNYEILRRLKEFDIFDSPVLVGVSRKSMVCKLLKTDALHALNGTSVVNTLALLQGADILRVHDVKEAVECIKIVQIYNGN